MEHERDEHRLRLSRRNFLGLGVSVAAGAAVGTLLRPGWLAPALAANELTEPPVLTSRKGVLKITLEEKILPVNVGGQVRNVWVYNGSFPGPTLKVRPGDQLLIKLKNSLAQETNLHTHGLHVSPSGNSDNPLLHVEPDETFDYQIDIPQDHPAGLNWYHPHAHGNGTQQIFGGLAGALLITGGLDKLDGIRHIDDRLLVLQSSQFDINGNVVTFGTGASGMGDPAKHTHFINGQLNPTITLEHDRLQRWRLLNATVTSLYQISLEGHTFFQIAADGNPFDEPVEMTSLVLVPGQRAEVLVRGGAPGSYNLQGTILQGPSNPTITLATANVLAKKGHGRNIPSTLIPLVDLRNFTVDHTRAIHFNAQGTIFTIDGKTFDPTRVDQTILLGALEEWTIYNDQTNPAVPHPFHIHMNPFQVTKINGVAVDAHSYQDTMNVPPNGNITFLTRFADFTGKTVFHCHIIHHQDQGMMSLFEVVAPNPYRRR
ncbi:MAG: multicopper oxidase family protein [Deltaproteobacteria bacterium]|nr:multicopper oxidase family protein [Deltaproteobacteria bacterium]